MGEIKANLLIRKLFRFLITPSLTDLVEVCAIDSVAFSSAPLLFLHNQKSQAVSWTNPKFPSFRRNSAVCFHTKIGYHHYLKLNQRTQSAPFCWILCVKVLSENWRAPLRTLLTNQKKSRGSTKLKLRVLKRLKTTVTWGQCAKLLITILDQELKWFLLRPKILQLGVVVTHSICEKRALHLFTAMAFERDPTKY